MTNSSVSGEYYDWKKTKAPERPYLHVYHQTLVMKIFLCWKLTNDTRGPNQIIDGSNVFLTFEQAADVIRRLDNLTLGIPKIIYLVGWQHNGHDSKYPDWSTVNYRLKRPQDATALDSLKWLMEFGFHYHTTVSLHINMFDAYEDSPLWETYLAQDIVAKNEQGKVILAEVGDFPNSIPQKTTQMYNLSYAREWETGLAQKRIDDLLVMLPIQKAGTIHIDAFHSLRPIPHAYRQKKYPHLPKSDKRISPYLNYSVEKEIAAQRQIFRYWRNKGVDVTSEGSTFLRPDPFIGLQPMAWHYNAPSHDIPATLYCGTPMQAEQEILRDPQNLSGLVEKFCCNVVPWHFQNHPSNVGSKFKTRIRQGQTWCVPVLWNKGTFVVYRKKKDYRKKIRLPISEKEVSKVIISQITQEGLIKVNEVSVDSGKIDYKFPSKIGFVIQEL